MPEPPRRVPEKANPKPRIAYAERRVKPLARLLRCATALRVTAPHGCGSGVWYGRKLAFGFAPNMNDNYHYRFKQHRLNRPRSPAAPTRRGRWPSPRRPPAEARRRLYQPATPNWPTLGALARLDAWRGTAPLDRRLCSPPTSASSSRRAARPPPLPWPSPPFGFGPSSSARPDPAGPATARVLGGYRRTAADRGRGQAAPLSTDGLAAILATAERPRTDGRGVESHTTAQRRGRHGRRDRRVVVHGRAAPRRK